MKRTADQVLFTFPVDGVMLTDAVGERIGDALEITARIDAKNGRNFTLNSEPLPNTAFGLYKKKVLLDKYKNTLELVDTDTGEKWSIYVYYLKKGYKKYRISLDDNIWFLQDLTEKQDEYNSMFDHPYLALIKSIHEKYGTKFHVNIYYETPRRNGFNLTQMTDKYKDEWKANSDWMRLSFHANADLPNRPYTHVTYDQMYFEAERVNKEILRFAGEEAFAKTVTTIHFGDVSVEGTRALRDLGYKAFLGDFHWKEPKFVDIRMYCDAEQCFTLQKYGFYYDKEEDVYFFNYNGEAEVQHIQPENIKALFDAKEEKTPFFKFMDICLHEQYSNPEFEKHQPNYYEKLDEVGKWCQEHGWESIFMDELFEFNTH